MAFSIKELSRGEIQSVPSLKKSPVSVFSCCHFMCCKGLIIYFLLGTNNARLAAMLRQLAQYHAKDPNNLFMVRLAQVGDTQKVLINR